MSIDNLLAEVDERVIARMIAISHDEARLKYTLQKNTVDNFDEFDWYLADYYNYHFTKCISNGGRFSHFDASERAKEIVERAYNKFGGNIISAFNDAHDGTNGGLRIHLDQIAEALKAESIERYINNAFVRYVEPNSWRQKVNLIRQFIKRCGPYLAGSINFEEPERYAQNYQELIRSYVEGLKNTSSIFRRF